MTAEELLDELPERLNLFNLPYSELHIRKIYQPESNIKYSVYYFSTGDHPKRTTPKFNGETLKECLQKCFTWCYLHKHVTLNKETTDN